MLKSLIRFEFQYYFRLPIYWLGCLVFFLLGLACAAGNFGGPEVYTNGPYAIGMMVGLFSLAAIFISTLLASQVLIRDNNYGMESFIFSTCLTKRDYFLVRFIVFVLIVFVVLACSGIGLTLGATIQQNGYPGAARPAFFLHPLLLIGLPNIVFGCSIVFVAALATRNQLIIYGAGVSTFIVYLIASVLSKSPALASSDPGLTANPIFPVLIDPFGIAAFFLETRSWSVIQKNTTVFTGGNFFLLNRGIWLAFSAALLIIVYRAFSFAPMPIKTSSREKTDNALPIRTYSAVYTNNAGSRYQWQAFRKMLTMEIGSFFKQPLFLVLLALWICLFGIDLKEELFTGPFGIKLNIGAGQIVEHLMSVKPALLLLAYYSAYLLHREKDLNTQQLLYSSPVSSSMIWISKAVSLAVLALILISANILLGMSTQFLFGLGKMNPSLFLSLYLYSGIPLLITGWLILILQSCFRNKYIGLLVGMLLVFVILFSNRLGLEHPILRIAGFPKLMYNSFNGFGTEPQAFAWYAAYWIFFCLLLTLPLLQKWPSTRLHGRTAGKKRLLYFALFIFGWLGIGWFIFGQINLNGNYPTKRSQQEWRLDYEKKYGPKRDEQKAEITFVKTAIDLNHQNHSYTIKGQYRIRNIGNSPIGELQLGIDPSVTDWQIAPIGLKTKTTDKRFKVKQIAFDKRLEAGDSIALYFSTFVSRSGFQLYDSEHSVQENGSYIELEKFLPYIGFNEDYCIDDSLVRKKAALSAIPVRQPMDSSYHLLQYETTISADSNQVIVSVGKPTGTFIKNGRRYSSFRTEQPINAMLAFAAARYECITDSLNGIALSIYFQRGEDVNVPSVLASVKAALIYCQRNFGSYGFTELKVAEIPLYRAAATAYPGMVFAAERIVFGGNYQNEHSTNQAFAITAHEVAHQWWANQLTPAAVPGTDLLTESLAKYTEAMVLEKAYGKQLLARYLRQENNLYFAMRNAVSKELPLSLTHNQPFVCYQKGGLVLYRIKELIGEERMNSCLKQLLEKYRYPGKRATAAALLEIFKTKSSAAEYNTISLLLEKLILYENKLSLISLKPLKNGKFALQLDLTIKKWDETELPGHPVIPDEIIDLTFYRNNEGKEGEGIQTLRQHITNANTRISILLDWKPGMIRLDPMNYFLEEDKTDNEIILP